MKQKVVKSLLALGLSAAMIVGVLPTIGWDVKAAVDISETVEKKLVYEESETNQLLTGDVKLKTDISGLTDEVITYSVGDADSRYVSIEGDTLKITRPYAGEGNYKFTLYATVKSQGASYTKQFPMTIWEGLSEDDYAGYLYVCFSSTMAETDVQQVHFYLSEDGLNWTAVNGNNPAFLTGSDYTNLVEQAAPKSLNYYVKKGTDVTETTKGDASVLFPFEGDDQGIRDPYLIRGCKADGSDSDKVWLLATDLNTHSYKYDKNVYDVATGENADELNRNNNALCSNFKNNVCGDWGITASNGSTSLFVWETEDFVNWERRYIDVGSEIGAGAAWAPEAIYNPEKDNYLVYWSCRVEADGRTKNRLYCNETEDFINFGPTKLYEAEPYFENYKPKGVGSNDGYGNIDTSQLWVPETDENGKILRDENGEIVNPYGTLYRLVKDETNKHIELMSAKTVLDPKVDYDASNPIKINDFTFEGTLYNTVEQLKGLSDSNDIKRSEITHNWFIGNSTGNHFTKINQNGIEKYTGAYEGATMFKFIDRDEWCIMIDNYVPMTVRYEPYVTTNLAKEDSIKKVAAGKYGREGGDLGCHGGMIPITLEEYNAIIDAYNSDSTVNNYHKIERIEIDKRGLTDKAVELRAAAKKADYSAGVVAQMQALADKAEALNAKADVTSKEVYQVVKRADALMANTIVKYQPGEAGGEDVTVPELPAVKSTHTIGGVKYQVTKVDEYNTDGTNGTVTVTGISNKKAKKVTLPNEVEINGYSFAVNKIAAKAFQNCSKLKTITIGDNVKSIGKNAFKGIHKKATFKVSSDNYDKMKKALKKKVGFKKPMKIKEI